MKKTQPAGTSKRPYSEPKLVSFGDIVSRTLSGGNSGLADAALFGTKTSQVV